MLEVLLPSFDVIAGAVASAHARSSSAAPVRRERAAAGRGRRTATSADRSAPTRQDPPATRSSEGEERELLRSIVDFGDRLVREVMTPRPDIVAIRADATLDELRAFFREQEYSRIPVYKDDLDNVLGFVFVKDLIKRGRPAGDDAGHGPACGPPTSCPRPSACPSC